MYHYFVSRRCCILLVWSTHHVKIWIWYHFLHCSFRCVGLFHCCVMGFRTIAPTCKKDYMMRRTVHCISWLQIIFSNIMWNSMQCCSCESRFSQLPTHGNKTWTICSIAIVCFFLTVWNMLINPILPSGNHSWSSNTLKYCRIVWIDWRERQHK